MYNIARRIRSFTPPPKTVARIEQIAILVLLLLFPSIFLYNLVVWRDPVKAVDRYYQMVYAGRYQDAVDYLSSSDRDFKYAAYFVKSTSPVFPEPVKELVKSVHCKPVHLAIEGKRAELICDLRAPGLQRRMTIHLRREWGRWRIHHGWDVEDQIEFEKSYLHKYHR
ncbi:MAG: hypothetical protein D6795_01915 [Deltaproteobacteria bacterium]|nr:MAG: hypothetical protein D6795_01915 [Deltaproteobacteria bacterium]